MVQSWGRVSLVRRVNPITLNKFPFLTDASSVYVRHMAVQPALVMPLAGLCALRDPEALKKNTFAWVNTCVLWPEPLPRASFFKIGRCAVKIGPDPLRSADRSFRAPCNSFANVSPRLCQIAIVDDKRGPRHAAADFRQHRAAASGGQAGCNPLPASPGVGIRQPVRLMLAAANSATQPKGSSAPVGQTQNLPFAPRCSPADKTGG